ncbi:MAG: hypothetical protein ACFFCJ_11980, partial [Promethearchaeota archaeon]
AISPKKRIAITTFSKSNEVIRYASVTVCWFFWEVPTVKIITKIIQEDAWERLTRVHYIFPFKPMGYVSENIVNCRIRNINHVIR